MTQKVLLHESDIWEVTGLMLKVLEGFHHWSAQRISVIMDRHMKDGEWEYLPVADALESSGIWKIKEYIQIW